MIHKIAIVGIGCCYPDAYSAQGLFENVIAKKKAFRDMPASRLDLDAYIGESEAWDQITPIQVALLEGYRFDRQKFRIPESTFEVTDLTHWLALDMADRALADSGIVFTDELREKTGVIVGNTLTGEFSRSSQIRLRWPFIQKAIKQALASQPDIDEAAAQSVISDTELLLKSRFPQPNEDSLSGGLANTIAGRVCNYYDFKGGGFTVDGACASSLLAVENACRKLTADEWSVAVCGGVDLSLDPFELVGFSRVGALAREEMRVYDRYANGFWPGEGCGFIILMRADKADTLELPIHAYIDGWGMSSDGRGGMTRPTVNGQLLALQRAYGMSATDPKSVTFFEGHGTGTVVGDKIELTALNKLIDGAAESIPVGSVKANIGHTKAAAGMASVIKSVMCLKEKVIPPTTGCEVPHPVFQESDIKLSTLAEPVEIKTRKPVAGVSGFGFGGINTHIVLHSPDGGVRSTAQTGLQTVLKEKRANTVGGESWQQLARFSHGHELFVLSAPNQSDLCEQAGALIGYNLSYSELASLAKKLAESSVGERFRACIVVASPRDFQRAVYSLLDYLKTRTLNPGQWYEKDSWVCGCVEGAAKVGFIYPGQSAPVGVKGGWMRRFFPFVSSTYALFDLVPDGEVDKGNTEWVQRSIVCDEISGGQWLKAANINAAVVAGHSVGELAAWHYAGVVDTEQIKQLVVDRGRAMHSHTPVNTGMISVTAPRDKLEALLCGKDLVVACENGADNRVISGPCADLESLTRQALAEGCNVVSLKVNGAYHSPAMRAAADAFFGTLAGTAFTVPTVPVLSTITGRPLRGDDDFRHLLYQQVTDVVQFSRVIEQLEKDVDIIIEVGPGKGLSKLVSKTSNKSIVNIDVTDKSMEGTLKALALSCCRGVDVDFSILYRYRSVPPLKSRPLSYLSNPCEGFDSSPTDFSIVDQRRRFERQENYRHAVEKVNRPGQLTENEQKAFSVNESDDGMVILQKLVSHFTGLSIDAIQAGDRLLDDLHLNSIAIANIIVKYARIQKRKLTQAPTDFSESTLQEVANKVALMDSAGDGDNESNELREPAERWIGCYTNEYYPVEVPQTENDPTIYWKTVYIGEQKDAQTPPFLGDLIAPYESDQLSYGVIVIFPPQPEYREIPQVVCILQELLDPAGWVHMVAIDPGGCFSGLLKSVSKERKELCFLHFEGRVEYLAQKHLGCFNSEEKRRWQTYRVNEHGELLTPRLKRQFYPEYSEQGRVPKGSDTFIFTGAAKGIGNSCAKYFIQRFGCRLAVIGSSSEDSIETRKGLKRLREHGEVDYYQCDLSDHSHVKQTIATIEREAGSIDGIIHAAGINTPCSFSHLKSTDVQDTLAVKASSVEYITDALAAPESLKWLVGFGSVIAQFGLHGEAHYAVANELLYQSIRKLSVKIPQCQPLVLDWSVWAEEGMAHKMNIIDSLVDQGIAPLKSSEACSVFVELFERNVASDRLFVSSRWGSHHTLAEEQYLPPLLRFLNKPKLYYSEAEAVFDVDLSEHTDLYLADHKLNGDCIFPGVMLLEAMAQAATSLGMAHPIRVDEVAFRQPVIVQSEQAVKVRFVAQKMNCNQYQVRVFSSTTSYEILHASGLYSSILEAGEGLCQPGSDTDKGALGIDVESLYESLYFNRGRFQRVDSFYQLSDKACQATVNCVDDLPWFSRYMVSGLLLGDAGARDACIHVLQACIPNERVIPESVKSISFIRNYPSSGKVWLTATEGEVSSNFIEFNIEIYNEQNQICERWQGLRLRRIEAILHPDTLLWSLANAYFTREARRLFQTYDIDVALVKGDDKARRKNLLLGTLNIDRATLVYEHRKPRLTDRREISFSHCQDYSLACVSSVAVGCDLELFCRNRFTRDLREALPVWARKMVTLLESDFAVDTDHAVFMVWCCFEAVLKVRDKKDGVDFSVCKRAKNFYELNSPQYLGFVTMLKKSDEEVYGVSLIGERTTGAGPRRDH
ncbi:SDR family NAD(P)-dependent oxidoreductase [Exilibacterium tricleocarpae]|uniref:SDR family NAD(P)-dependent oxidoreductase n=1 Tax=Exilibacterium tricleocarpae TaxID=2591008 RepID=A0A545U9L0_9GAMM|nr:type I polyketide synthase [Exilibacterium tricleocarpae]TQV86162.1 SDR family NAD(P)-dependent oxidoreductase [Exilibacterium tricleocarpae]